MYNRDDVFAASLKYFDGDELAANVFFKYALQDKDGNYHELTPSDMHKRLAGEFARIEKSFGGKNALSYDKIYEYLDGFRKIVPQGSPMFGIGNSFQTVSLSNCFVIQPPNDTMSGIFDSGKDLANLSKRRGGVGIDISSLRPDGASVNNSAKTSSGAWSFADFYSNIGRMVGQNGRRAALIITIDVRHPDIEKFITMKNDLTKVTGANVSIKISNDFMKAVENDSDFTLQWPVDSGEPTITSVIKAKDLWDKMVYNATNFAEPGLLFWDKITEMLPAECYAADGFKTITVNPCGEINLSANDSCRLVSVNLKNFVKHPFSKKAYFDFNEFYDTVCAAQRLSDDIVELEIEKLQLIKGKADTKDERELFQKLLDSCRNGRRTGLGTHGLADALSSMCLRYDSDKAIELVESIYKEFRNASYKSSNDLAKERGAFPVWDWEKEKNNPFIKSLDDNLQKDIKKYGRRNISNLTNAPTGSVSILSQTSSGIEPVFRNHYIRRKKINHNEKHIKVDFVDNVGDSWVEFDVIHHNVKEYMNLHKCDKDNLPGYFVTSDNIDWEKRLVVQAAIQKYIDHSVSNTVNLPNGTPTSVVSKLYFDGWKLGLKGITVYVDGCRSGVLVSEQNDDNSFKHHDAPKRNKDMTCNIHNATIKGEKWTILIGLLDGKPYEVFGGLSDKIEIPKKYTSGVISKHPSSTKNKSRYDLFFGDDGVIKDITNVFDNVAYQVHTRMISLALRHGAKPSFLVEQLQKDPDNDLTSFSRVLARVLKKYIEDGTRVSGDKTCGSCDQVTLVYIEGCAQCTSCGWSKCG